MKSQGYPAVLALLCGLFGSVCPVAAEKTVQVIVHFENSDDSLSPREMQKAFLKNKGEWPKSGIKIIPVDLPMNSPLRKNFAENILNMTIDRVNTELQKLTLGGRGREPKEVSNEQKVIQYVAQNPGAIGYISGSAELNPDVKVLNVKSAESSGNLGW